MKKLLLIAFLFITIFSLGQVSFERTFGDTLDNTGTSLVTTFDEGYLFAFKSSNDYNQLMRIDKYGNVLWVKDRYQLKTGVSSFVDLIQTKDSNFIVLYNQRYLLKLNQMGDTLWRKPISLTVGHNFVKIVEDTSGNIVAVGGYTLPSPNGCCAALIKKLDSSGNVIPSFAGYNCNSGLGCLYTWIKVANDGNYIVSGTTLNMSPYLKIIKMNPSGSTIWNRTYHQRYVELYDKIYIVEKPNSNLVVATNFNNQFTPDSTIIRRLNSNGSFINSQSFDLSTSTGQVRRSGLALVNGGYFVLTQNGDLNLMKFDMNDSLLFTRNLGGSALEFFTDIESTADGGAVVLGTTESYGMGGKDAYLIKLDSSGLVTFVKSIIPSNLIYKIYPNPTTGIIHVSELPELKKIEMYNLKGQLVQKFTPSLNSSSFEITGKKGLYLIQFTMKDGSVSTTKIMKE